MQSTSTVLNADEIAKLDPVADFSEAEYRRRMELVRAAMTDRGVDSLVIDQLDHVAWLFGYLPTAARYQGALIPADGEPVMFVRELDLSAFLDQSWVSDYVTYADDEDEIGRLIDLIRERGGSRVGFEFDSNIFTAERYLRLGAELPLVELVDFSRVIWELRVVKSDEELACLRRAAQIADAAVTAGIQAIRVGASEREPAVATYSAGLAAGADNGRISTFGYGATVDSMHGRLGMRTLERGELYFIEAVPQVLGYSSRLVRPISIGTASDERRHLAERLIAIQDNQIAAMQVGVSAGEVDAVCRDAILNEGIKDTFPQVTGYTLGYHAVPRTADHTRIMVPGQTWTLEENTVFHIILYSRGIAFSETVLVTKNGPERLTNVERKLFEHE